MRQWRIPSLFLVKQFRITGILEKLGGGGIGVVHKRKIRASADRSSEILAMRCDRRYKDLERRVGYTW